MEDKVTSEVHENCSSNALGGCISHFTYLVPSVSVSDVPWEETREEVPRDSSVKIDEDGDLILPRRRELASTSRKITIQHYIMTSSSKYGLQVWKPDLVLADYILHKRFTSSDLEGIVAVQLGCGTGLVGILLAHNSKVVFLTDYDTGVLDNCAKNVELNYDLVGGHSSVHVRVLDWRSSWPQLLDGSNDVPEWYSWTSSDIDDINKASILVAADVIYSDDQTDALFSMLEKLMSLGSKKVLYLALQKRYNFCSDELRTVVTGYSHFLCYLKAKEPDEKSPGFVGECIDLSTIPQYVREYNRDNDVELWKIRYTAEE